MTTLIPKYSSLQIPISQLSNSLNIDLSFLNDYTPIFVPTERYTQMIMLIFLMMMALLGMNRGERRRREWVAAI